MQAVRSRATQAQRFCNCTSCLSITNALTRRTTTVTARRSVPFGDVWTVSLSSLAFGLAVADSKSKNDRRKQWDKVIGEAKATVEETEREQTTRLAALLDARLSALDDRSIRLDDGKKQQQRRLIRPVVTRGGPWRHGADALDVVEEEVIGQVKAWVALKRNEVKRVNCDTIRNQPVEALDAQESKALVRRAPGRNKLVAALDAPESKEWVRWTSFLSSQMETLIHQQSEELVEWMPFPNRKMDALNPQESEELVRQTPVSHNEFETWLDVFEWAREHHQIREASGFQNWKGPRLSLLQSLSAADLYELLADKRLLRYFYGGPDCANLVDRARPYRLTIKKIRILEWSIAKLVLSLLMYSSKPWDDPGRPTTSLLRNVLGDKTIESKIGQIQERIRLLHIDHIDFSYYADLDHPSLPNYDGTIVADDEQTREMNRSLHHLLVLMEESTDPGDVMSKICYHLLTARAPPNTDTYNLLLVRFSLLAMEDHFKAALISMRQSHIRPNEITHTTALLHFTRMEDRVAFFHTLELMEGRRYGLTAKSRELVHHPLLREQFFPRGKNSRMAIEKARMNGQVYESVIVGAMKFVRDGIARQYYRRMISEGWSPTFGTLLAILQDCCRRVDWTVGYEVLQQLEKTAEKVNTLTYEWMLRLCQRCRQSEFFDQILINGVRCGALPASMLALTDRDKAKGIGYLIKRAKSRQPPKAIGRLEKAATKLGHRLGYDGPYFMENIFNSCNDQETLHHTLKRTEKIWRARDALERRLNRVSKDIASTFKQASPTLRVSENSPIVKYWLSKEVERLETDLVKAEAANQISYTSYSDMVERQKVQQTQTETSDDGTSESGNPEDLPPTTNSAEHEAEYASHLPPEEEQQHNLVQPNPPNQQSRTYPPTGSIWDAPSEQMAAMA